MLLETFGWIHCLTMPAGLEKQNVTTGCGVPKDSHFFLRAKHKEYGEMNSHWISFSSEGSAPHEDSQTRQYVQAEVTTLKDLRRRTLLRGGIPNPVPALGIQGIAAPTEAGKSEFFFPRDEAPCPPTLHPH